MERPGFVLITSRVAMKIHEYQAKEILRGFGVATPRGRVTDSPEEAGRIAKEFGGRAVVTFPAAVPAFVVVRAVAVVLSVRFVVFPVVANQVGQREAVVAGDEVDGRCRAATVD